MNRTCPKIMAMLRNLSVAVVFIFCIGKSGRANGDILVLDHAQIPDVGIMCTGHAKIKIKNGGSSELTISHVSFSCSCARTSKVPSTMGAGATSVITMEYDGRATPGSSQNLMKVDYTEGGVAKVVLIPVEIRTIVPDIRLDRQAYDFGRKSAILLEPIRFTIVNTSAHVFELVSWSAPTGFAVDTSSLGSMRSLSAGSAATVALRPMSTIPAGSYAASMQLSFVQQGTPSVVARLEEKITGEIISPTLHWSDGGVGSLDLGSPAPYVTVQIPASKVLSASISAPFTICEIRPDVSDNGTTRLILGLTGEIEAEQQIVGRLRLIMDDERCPLAEYPFERILSGSATSECTSVKPFKISVSVAPGRSPPKILAVYDGTRKPVSWHQTDKAGPTTVECGDITGYGVLLQLGWSSGAVEERFVPARNTDVGLK